MPNAEKYQEKFIWKMYFFPNKSIIDDIYLQCRCPFFQLYRSFGDMREYPKVDSENKQHHSL
jgi:hypothetical protein